MIDQDSPFGKMLLELFPIVDRLKSIQEFESENLQPVFFDLEKIIAIYLKYNTNSEIPIDVDIDELRNCIKQLDLKTFHDKLLLLEDKLGLWWI
jgi:hypothetical protein